MKKHRSAVIGGPVCFLFYNLFNDERGTVLDLEVNLADVLADDAESGQTEAAEEDQRA